MAQLLQLGGMGITGISRLGPFDFLGLRVGKLGVTRLLQGFGLRMVV